MTYYIRPDATGSIEGPLTADEIHRGLTAGRWSRSALVALAAGQSKFELESGDVDWFFASTLGNPGEPGAPGPPKSEAAPEAVTTAVAHEATRPVLESVFKALALMEVVGGVVLGTQLWPGDPQVGYEWRMVAYVPALTWIAAGFIFGCLFWAVGDALKYLHRIDGSLRRIANK